MHGSLSGFDSKSSQLRFSIGIEILPLKTIWHELRLDLSSVFRVLWLLAVNKLLCAVFPSLIEYPCCFVFQLKIFKNKEILRLSVTFPLFTRRVYFKTTLKSGEKSLIKFRKQETFRC